MQIELRRFTTNARLSQETTAFAADVWVGGKKAGHAQNDGQGGCTMVHLDMAVRDQVEAHGKTLVPAKYADSTGGTEWIVDQLVEAELVKRDEKAFAKRVSTADAKHKARYKEQGLQPARFRHADTWYWFGFKADAKAAATAIAIKHKITVDELVML